MVSNQNRFVYQKRDVKQWEDRGNRTSGSGISIFKPGTNLYKIKEGDNYIRILPPTWKDAAHFAIDVQMHLNIGPDRLPILCSYRMLNKKCPICEARGRAEKAGDDARVEELYVSRRSALYILDMNSKSDDVLAWSMPWTLDRDICKLAFDKRTGETVEVDNPDAGHNVSFERSGTGKLVRYAGIRIEGRASSIPADVLNWIVDNPLDEQLLWRTYGEIQDIFEGTDTDAPSERSTRRSEDKTEERGRDVDERSSRGREDTRSTQRRTHDNNEQPWDDDRDTDRRSNRTEGREERRSVRNEEPERRERTAEPEERGRSERASFRRSEREDDAPPPRDEDDYGKHANGRAGNEERAESRDKEPEQRSSAADRAARLKDRVRDRP